MAICEKCGVEIDDCAQKCPLCGLALKRGERNTEPVNVQLMPEFADQIRPLSVKQRARLVWEISSLMFFSAVIVVIFFDFIVNKRITWSVFPIIATGSAWILSSLISFFYRFPLVLFLGAYIDSLIFLFLIDIASQRLPWFVELGLPISSCFFLLVGALCFVVFRINRRGLNIPAFIVFAIGLFTVGIEATLDWYLFRSVGLSWSALVLVSVTPVAGILLFVHYRLRKYVDLKRFFHL
ncbi:MAG: zinc ribbon domain-containing protein [Spirochaetales bacterium]|nr:zinc ribbon domain-containing protein [Spirochaetales bacterium]